MVKWLRGPFVPGLVFLLIVVGGIGFAVIWGSDPDPRGEARIESKVVGEWEVVTVYAAPSTAAPFGYVCKRLDEGELKYVWGAVEFSKGQHVRLVRLEQRGQGFDGDSVLWAVSIDQ